jgi:hypothetical protein
LNDDALVYRGQDDDTWQDERSWRELLGKRTGCALDPFPVFLNERFDSPGAGSAWNDDLHPPARKHLDGQSFCPGAFAHRKARQLAGLICTEKR